MGRPHTPVLRTARLQVDETAATEVTGRPVRGAAARPRPVPDTTGRRLAPAPTQDGRLVRVDGGVPTAPVPAVAPQVLAVVAARPGTLAPALFPATSTVAALVRGQATVLPARPAVPVPPVPEVGGLPSGTDGLAAAGGQVALPLPREVRRAVAPALLAVPRP